MDGSMVTNSMVDFTPQIKRQRMTPPLSERVMLYVRQDNEDVYTPLHVVPPSTVGLLNAVSVTIVTHLLLQIAAKKTKEFCNMTHDKEEKQPQQSTNCWQFFVFDTIEIDSVEHYTSDYNN